MQPFFRTVYFLPSVISISVVGLLFQLVYHPSIGLLNQGLRGIGLGGLCHAWLGEKNTAIFAIIATSQWQYMGYIMLLFLVAIQKIPQELYEAAEIDGCGRLQTMRRVILPIMRPSIVSVGLYAFINAWNEFMFGYIFISQDRFRTITPAIMLFKGANSIDWGGLMAASVIAVLPVAFVFLFLQRFFMAGMMSGAVKG